MVDFGDCALDPHSPLSVPDAIENHARSILAADTAMLTIGGDHFIAYPLIKAHAAKHGPDALLRLSAAPSTAGASCGPSTL